MRAKGLVKKYKGWAGAFGNIVDEKHMPHRPSFCHKTDWSTQMLHHPRSKLESGLLLIQWNHILFMKKIIKHQSLALLG